MPHDKDSGAKPAGPCAMVIFGAGGDLTKRLIIPALYNLTCARLLPPEFAIIGFDRIDQTDEEWRNGLAKMTEEFVTAGDEQSKFNRDAWQFLADRMSYFKGDLAADSSYEELKRKLADTDRAHSTSGNYLFYLAVAERFFGSVIEHLGHSCLTCETGSYWRRVVVEKPFGHDLQSAQDLDKQILKVISENQVYRIDHFLGKE